MPRLNDETLKRLKDEAWINREAGDSQLATALDLLLEWYDQQAASFDLIAHLERQSAWSLETFGPGARTAGVIDHIRKELREIEAAPRDLEEWVDLISIGFDGACRAGHTPQEIIAAWVAKLAENISREWPDWRTAPRDKAIEHVRKTEGAA